MDLSATDKLTVLLQALSRQAAEIERREARELQLFEWTTGLLVAAFGVVVALSDRDTPLPHAATVKLLATLLLAVPTLLFAWRIRRYSRLSIQNAVAVERIEELLRLFEPGYYGAITPYPPEWQARLAAGRRKRTTWRLYSAILLLMAGCVVATIWLIL